jgi:transcriptional regulator with PAS, ATPase and Fis domain
MWGARDRGEPYQHSDLSLALSTYGNCRSTVQPRYARYCHLLVGGIKLISMESANSHWKVYEHGFRRHEAVAGSSDVERCDQLVGSSKELRNVYDLIRRVSNLPAVVLINGESGTGKELVARAIHNVGTRASRPFVAVSCGAIPETLIEAELFGHEKGAFTGSVGSREGLLEKAADGTLFLDEIGELTPSVQVKLLRVLQQREFSRLGSSKTIPLRARVLFATHRNLRDMVDAGTFREDLYYRVAVVTIDVPALRERPEDIATLARHMLQKYAQEYDKPVQSIRPEAMDMLMAHDWPGNIRELENVIQRSIILADGSQIGATDLPDDFKDLVSMNSEGGEVDESFNCASFDELIHEFRISVVRKAIAESKGNKSLAARKLGLSRAYLHRLMRTGPQLVRTA